jgi:hypothetical protein
MARHAPGSGYRDGRESPPDGWYRTPPSVDKALML